MRSSKLAFGILATVGALAFTGLAFAQEGVEEEPQQAEEATEEVEETVFNFGYDKEFHLFSWNTTSTGDPHDCSLQGDPVNATYVVGGDEVVVSGDEVVVDKLTRGKEGSGDEEPVTFPERDPDAIDPPLGPLPYTPGGECGLRSAEVAGPNGQINHGMFMKLWNSLYEGTGRGCINRYLAQSDLGKDDQQLKTSEVDPDFKSVRTNDIGQIDFTTVVADCERPKQRGNSGENGNGNADNKSEKNGNGHGRNHEDPDPEGAQTASTGNDKSESRGGRSADAPGHNK